jgi:hypothetical protein
VWFLRRLAISSFIATFHFSASSIANTSWIVLGSSSVMLVLSASFGARSPLIQLEDRLGAAL